MKIKHGVVVQKMGETCVAYDNDKSVLHEMNEVGYIILDGLLRGEDKEKIIKVLTERFNVEMKIVLKDYEEFLKELERKDLIQR